MTSLKNIFDQIDEKVSELKSLLPLKPEDQQRLDKKFRLEFNYNSNHIEGNTLTYGETELLLIFDKTKGDHEKREYDEMSGHDIALQMIQQEANDDERPLTEQFIRLLNEQILVRPFWKEAITQDGQPTRKQIIPGQYKTTPNSVRLQNGEIFNYSSPEDTIIQMSELVAWYNENSKRDHPLLLAALLHYRFVCIHPFDDGNGRISRLLMNYVLLKSQLPMVVIKSEEKKSYLNALNQADIGDIDAFISYVGKQLLWSLDLNIKAAKGESIEEPDDLDKKIAILSKKINSDKKEIKTNTAATLKQLYEGSLVLLIDKIYFNIEKFLKFYEHITWSFEWDSSSQYSSLKQFEEQFHESIIMRQLSFKKIKIEYLFSGFKADVTSGFQFFGSVEIQFEHYRYSIVSNNNTLKKYYSYDDPLSDRESNDLITQLVNQIYEDTERKIEQIKKTDTTS